MKREAGRGPVGLAGYIPDPDRFYRGAGGPVAGFGQGFAPLLGGKGGDDGAAIAALAAAHAAAGLALEGADGLGARRQACLDLRSAQLLAAADQGVGGGELGQQARGAEEIPETRLEAAMAAKRAPRRQLGCALPRRG